MKIYLILLIIVFSLAANIFSQIQFTSQTIVDNASGTRSVYATDVDGDGDIDVLSANFHSNEIAWYENDGNENFTFNYIAYASDPYSVYAVDLDSDGDIDVLSANTGIDYINQSIRWYENDGNENFTSHDIEDPSAPFSIYAVDVDGDGDIDVLSASAGEDKIHWYENDGNENFTTHILADTLDFPYSVYAADVDDDGDMDVLSASQNDDTIAWYENDGEQNFISHTVTTNAVWAQSVYAIDVDGDGDMDVLSSSSFYDNVSWYENDGNENFTAHTVSTFFVSGANLVYAIDLDGDGDIDVISENGGNLINWYENDGDENFTTHTITTNANYIISIYAVDLDSDEDIDILSADWNGGQIDWCENLGVVGIDDNNLFGAPAQFQLYNNYPNPFNPTTIIKYEIPELSFTTLKIYDVLGNEIANLVNEEKQSGYYKVEFNSINLVSGIYFYKLQAGNFVETKKMIVLK